MGIPARAAVEAPEGGRAPQQMSAQTAYTCLRGAQPRPTHRQTATFVDAARHMVGMRLSALRLPLIAGGESILVLGCRQSSGA